MKRKWWLAVAIFGLVLAVWRLRTPAQSPDSSLTPHEVELPKTVETLGEPSPQKEATAPQAKALEVPPQETPPTAPNSTLPEKQQQVPVALDPSVPGSELFKGKVPGFPELTPAVMKILEESRNLVQRNQPEKALEVLEAAMQERPDDGYLTVEYAQLQRDVFRNLDKAENAYADLVRRHPESNLAAAAYGDFLASTGKDKEALPYLTKVAEANTAPAEAVNRLAQQHMKMGNPREAGPLLERAQNLLENRLNEVRSQGGSTIMISQQIARIALDRAYTAAEQGQTKDAADLLSQAKATLGADSASIRSFEKYLASKTNPKPPSPIQAE